MAASQPRLDRDPVALLETPSARRLSADFLDHADRLMPRHDRQLQAHAVELAVVLVDVAAANSARLDAHQGVVVADSGQLEFLDLVAPVAHLYDGTCLRHSSSLPSIRRRDESGDSPCVSFLQEALTIAGGMPLRQSRTFRLCAGTDPALRPCANMRRIGGEGGAMAVDSGYRGDSPGPRIAEPGPSVLHNDSTLVLEHVSRMLH